MHRIRQIECIRATEPECAYTATESKSRDREKQEREETLTIERLWLCPSQAEISLTSNLQYNSFVPACRHC